MAEDNGWTVQMLKELRLADNLRFEQRFADQEKAVAAALDAAGRATAKAESANEKRFESVNEFRAAMKEQADTYATKPEVNLMVDTLNAKLQPLITGAITQQAAKAGGTNLWGLIIGVVGLLALLYSTLLRK